MTVLIAVKDKRLQKKKFLDLKRSLETEFSRQKVQMQEHTPTKGQMGAGLLSILSMVLDNKILDNFIEFIQKFVASRKVNLVIENAHGEKIELSANLSSEQIAQLLNNFFEKELLATRKTRAKKPINNDKPLQRDNKKR